MQFNLICIAIIALGASLGRYGLDRHMVNLVFAAVLVMLPCFIALLYNIYCEGGQNG